LCGAHAGHDPALRHGPIAREAFSLTRNVQIIS
jgi:hypothetical protein